MANQHSTKFSDQAIIEAWKKTPSAAIIAGKFGVDVTTIHKRIRTIRIRHPEIKLASPDKRSPYYGEDAVTQNVFAITNSPGRITADIEDGVVLIGSDAHYWPGIITTAHRAFVKFAKELKPKIVVLNGDIFDGASISRFPRIGWDRRPSVLDELNTCKERLAEIEDAAGKARKIWPLGNHDGRFEVRLAQAVPEYEGIPAFHLKDHFPAWMPCWGVHLNPDKPSYTIIKHRMKGGIHAVRNNVLAAGTNVVTAHLHSSKVIPFTDYRGTCYGVDVGCLAEPYGDQFTDYTEDNPKDWRSGFAVLTYWKGILLYPELVQIMDEDHVQFRGQVIEV